MNVMWAATSLASERFEPLEQSGFDRLVARFEELRTRGVGYLEVRAGAELPVLTLGFKGDLAVVHRLSGDGRTSLLVANPPASADAAVPVMDDLVDFDATFVLDSGRAWQLIQEFAHTGHDALLGQWCEL